MIYVWPFRVAQNAIRVLGLSAKGSNEHDRPSRTMIFRISKNSDLFFGKKRKRKKMITITNKGKNPLATFFSQRRFRQHRFASFSLRITWLLLYIYTYIHTHLYVLHSKQTLSNSHLEKGACVIRLRLLLSCFSFPA